MIRPLCSWCHRRALIGVRIRDGWGINRWFCLRHIFHENEVAQWKQGRP